MRGRPFVSWVEALLLVPHPWPLATYEARSMLALAWRPLCAHGTTRWVKVGQVAEAPNQKGQIPM